MAVYSEHRIRSHMLATILIVLGSLAVAVLVAAILFVRWGAGWGSTEAERAASMVGDAFLDGGPKVRVRMTRAISIAAPRETVWRWIAQMGRGAGWYSVERLDNGGKTSAEHLVSWIPEPALGDAAAVGYLRYLDPGQEIAWWLNGEKWLGATVRMVANVRIAEESADRTRVVIRMSADGRGLMARPIAWLFELVDTIMVRRQLLGLRERAERYGVRDRDPDREETCARDQYQLFEVIFASGERAGVSGKEKAPLWRETAIEDGVLPRSAAP